MSTRTSKKTTVTSSSSVSSTPQGSAQQASTSSPYYGGRPSSPLSPTRMSRLQEKQDLQNLNDRLATYIDRVRQLESENSGLRREVQTSQETTHREVSSIKSMYESELADARKLLDDTARDRAKLEIESKRLWEDNNALKIKLDKKTKDLTQAEKNVSMYEARVADLTRQYNQAASERIKANNELKDLEKENETLRKQVEDLRKHLEDETLARVDLENNLQSLKEELMFKEQVYNQELTETRTRRQVEISEIDGRLMEQYEDKLQQSLQELRDQYEAQMRVNREEIEMLYEAKIKSLTSQTQRNIGAASVAVEELRQSRTRMEDLNGRVSELESTNAGLMSRIRDLEILLDGERLRHKEERDILNAELQALRDEMANQLLEYQGLMDIKVALDLEIAAYRKLLESEEARLNISPMQSPAAPGERTGTPMRRTPVRGSKRKRTTLEESEESSLSNYRISSHAKGDVEISEVCSDGKYIKLHNKGSKEMVLSGWQLLRRAGDSETIFKFHRSVKIDGGATITVWSFNAGQTHEPPTNIVMKGQKWFVADNMTTTLLNSAGEEVAVSERIRQQLSSASSRHREVSGYLAHRASELGREEIFHQQGDPQGEDRCRLM